MGSLVNSSDPDEMPKIQHFISVPDKNNINGQKNT